MRFVFAVICALSWTGCTTISPVYGAVELPKESAAECATHCNTLGMKLTGVVVIRNSVGCVCEPKDTQMNTPRGAVSAAVGGSIIADEEEEEARRRNQMQNSSSPSGPRR